MITCDVGINGRFGNQMFQYASLIGIATKQNFEYGINYNLGNNLTWNEFGVDNTYHLLTLDKAFNLSAKQYSTNYPETTELTSEFHFQEKFFKTVDNVKLRGYFQTEKYFEHCIDQIKNEFTFKKDIYDTASSFLKNKRDYELVSVHIRRGDYMNLPWHGLCDMKYYNKALQTHFSDKSYNFIVITDDVDWAKTSFLNGSNNIFISESHNQFVDMCIMTLCDHNIIANSSFSWWGSWLNSNPNKKVVAPSVWFREHLKELNTKDLYQKKWIIV